MDILVHYTRHIHLIHFDIFFLTTTFQLMIMSKSVLILTKKKRKAK